METGSYGGLDRRVIDNIRFNARRLAWSDTVRDMDREDYEQDLVHDLLRRRPAFNPELGSFRTFADRVVRHRACALTASTARTLAEQQMLSLDAPVTDEGGNGVCLGDLISDPSPPVDDQVMLRVDVGRFVGRLPAPLVDCCAILLADSVVEGVAAAGIHRSTAYERINRLRDQAIAEGLDIYVSLRPDSSRCPPVSGDQGPRDCPSGTDREPTLMVDRTRAPRVVLRVSEAEVRRWLATAESGAILEYHRGALAADRLRHATRLAEKDRRELDRVANIVLALAQAGCGYVLQRKHGIGDYSYLFVARGRTDRTAATLLLADEDRS